jgi:hypothetical protein
MRRDMTRLRLVRERMKIIEKTRQQKLIKAPLERTNPMVLMQARVMGIGIETADMLVHEVLMRNLRDRGAVARYAGITGAPNESGNKWREKACHGPVMPGCGAAWYSWLGAGSHSRRTVRWRSGTASAPQAPEVTSARP